MSDVAPGVCLRVVCVLYLWECPPAHLSRDGLFAPCVCRRTGVHVCQVPGATAPAQVPCVMGLVLWEKDLGCRCGVWCGHCALGLWWCMGVAW
jgi:hypothetical protein